MTTKIMCQVRRIATSKQLYQQAASKQLYQQAGKKLDGIDGTIRCMSTFKGGSTSANQLDKSGNVLWLNNKF